MGGSATTMVESGSTMMGVASALPGSPAAAARPEEMGPQIRRRRLEALVAQYTSAEGRDPPGKETAFDKVNSSVRLRLGSMGDFQELLRDKKPMRFVDDDKVPADLPDLVGVAGRKFIAADNDAALREGPAVPLCAQFSVCGGFKDRASKAELLG